MTHNMEINNGNGTVYMKIGVKGLAATIIAYIVGAIIWGATITQKVYAIETYMQKIETRTDDRWRGEDQARYAADIDKQLERLRERIKRLEDAKAGRCPSGSSPGDCNCILRGFFYIPRSRLPGRDDELPGLEAWGEVATPLRPGG